MDMLVEGTDVPRGMSYRQAARKAVAMCVSDFAAKGVRPDSFLVSLGLRRGSTQKQIDEIGDGLRDAEREWGMALLGGDTNEAAELVIDCAMIGYAKRIVERKGAKPGDTLVVTGPFGYEPAGLKLLEGEATASKRFRAQAIDRVLKPNPNLKAGLALAPYLTSAMDSSDGLARSLHTLAAASEVGFEVDSLPEGEGVREFAKRNGLAAKDLVLEGGEEYVVVGTLRRPAFPIARRLARASGAELIPIGKVTRTSKEVVLVSGKDRAPVRDAGWTHLS